MREKQFLHKIKPRVEGLEPSNGGTKTRCLTTWRHSKFKCNYFEFINLY